jgi:hypothetical protein
VYGRTREQVHTQLVELQDRSARGIPRPDHLWKVGGVPGLLARNIARPAARPTTFAKYETMTRLYLRPGLGRYRLDRLTVTVVQSWLNSRLAAGDSIAKVHVMRTVLGSALTRAMREELVSATSPAWPRCRPTAQLRSSRGRSARHVPSCKQRAVTGCTRRLSCYSSTACAEVRSSD